VLNDWRTDTLQHIALHYNISLYIYDENGKLLTENSLSGKDNLGHGLSAKKDTIPNAFKMKIEEIFNSPNVINALSN